MRFCVQWYILFPLCWRYVLSSGSLNDDSSYTVTDGNKTCLYASFEMTFYIYQHAINSTKPQVATYSLPRSDDETVNVSGQCNDATSLTTRVLEIDWEKSSYTFHSEIRVTRSTKNWTLSQISFSISSTDNEDDMHGIGNATFTTKGGDLFERKFKLNQYFYCKGCKKFEFNNDTDAVACVDNKCSYVTIENSKIYPGDFQKDKPEKQLCMEDWIAQREIIVPIAVGAFLGLLLIIITVAYLGAFIRRKVIEKRGARYQRVQDDQ